MTPDPRLKPLQKLVGSWTTEMTHPALPGVVVRGTARMEWIEGGHFLTCRSTTDHPDFPHALSVIGFTDQDRIDGPRVTASTMHMHYFDSRGVFRLYDFSIDDAAWRFVREAPGFAQRFTGTFADGGNTIRGLVQMKDGTRWNDDLAITYRRTAST